MRFIRKPNASVPSSDPLIIAGAAHMKCNATTLTNGTRENTSDHRLPSTATMPNPSA